MDESKKESLILKIRIMSSSNGNSDPQKIKFPIKYQLKLIMDNSITKKENIKNISDKLNELTINFGPFSSKVSSKASYISLTTQVRIVSEEQFKVLYIELNKVKGLKTAI